MGSFGMLCTYRRTHPVPGMEGSEAEDGESSRHRCAGMRNRRGYLLYPYDRAWHRNCFHGNVTWGNFYGFFWVSRASDRSFYWHGRQFPICARCTGELAGILIGIPAILLLGRLSVPVMILFMLPMLIDDCSASDKYTSTNLRRVVTGFFLALPLTACSLFPPYLRMDCRRNRQACFRRYGSGKPRDPDVFRGVLKRPLFLLFSPNPVFVRISEKVIHFFLRFS